MLPTYPTKHGFVSHKHSYLAASALLTLSACGAALAAPAHPVTAPVAAHPAAHRSIWAARWALAHPAQEVAYQHRLTARRPQHPAMPSQRKIAMLRPLTTPTVRTKTMTAKTFVAGALRQRRAAEATALSSDDVTLDFVAADINDVLKALAVQTGANIVASTDVKGTVTVSLAHVTLEQALDMVARLSGYQYAKIGNTYVVGTPASIQTMTGGAGSGAGPVTSVLTFNYANPDDVASLLKSRFPNINISTGTSVSGKKAGAGAKALILSGDPTMVAQARDLVAQVDASLGANVTQQTTETYSVKYASLPDLINILGSLVPNMVVTPGPSQGFLTKAPSAGAAAASTGSAGVSSEGGGAAASGSGATGSSQSTSSGPNMLLLTGAPTDIARARLILAQVDVQPAQLLFETKVTEISDSDQRNIGLNWDFTGAKTQISELYNAATLPSSSTTPGVTVVKPDYPGQILKFGTFGRSQINNLATVTLDALITNGRAHLLADPNIAAITGQPAQVFIGDTINYVQSITQSTTGENVTTASVQVGVILRVTGKAGPDGYVTLNIHPEVSEITGFLAVPGGGSLPQIASRYADTTIRVKDGDTIAIGGLIQDNITENVNKVPILGDLPFFGQLFRDSKKNKTRTEVVFFLKTSVMKTT